MTLRYLLALVSLVALLEAVVLWRRSKYSCADKRCIQRDHEFLNLLQQANELRRDASLLVKQNVFLAQRVKKYRSERDHYRERCVSAEAAVYLKGERG